MSEVKPVRWQNAPMPELSPPAGSETSHALEAGREAFGRHAWPAAYEEFDRADQTEALTGADLEAFSEAAFFVARADRESELGERAFKAYQAAGDTVRAAYVAILLARRYAFAGKGSIASAWLRRGERLLPAEPETYAHGFLAVTRSESAATSGDVDLAVKLAEEAVEISTRVANADLQASAMSNLGGLKIRTGATADGFALMEEASIAAVNGELSPITTGITCCSMIAACRDLTDYRRATEWTEATEAWCKRESVSGFPGICRVHRAEVVAVSGAWDRAELELQRATAELEGYNAIPPLADGLYALGDIKRLKGDFEGAEAALRQAHALGRTPQPALAFIRLAEGKTKAALTAITSALQEESWDHVTRMRLLPAEVEVAVAAGDVGLARSAVDELVAITETYATPALDATRLVALGRVRLAEGDASGAADDLRRAIRSWREVGAPFEIARSRAVLAMALRAIGDDDAADLELQAALTEFERLGARIDAQAAEGELQAARERRLGPSQARRTFMFTDIAGSTKLAEALGDAAWDRLLRWHDETLRSLVVAGGGEIVKSTGDGFFAAFDAARQAVDCAISIQRALVEHRRSSGFALSVRIGIHTAEASRRGSDYSGVGVHTAARVADLAGAGEILATAETLAEAGRVASGSREAAVKGVTSPITVALVDWTAAEA